MKKYYKLLLINCLLLLLSYVPLQAQDIHFSQYWNTPLELNPALTGVTKEDTRIFGAYKSQWASVPVAYTTFSGAIDTKWTPIKIEKGYFGLGLIFNHDQAGDSDWTLNNFSALISYTKQLKKGIFCSVGGQIGVGQRSFKLLELTFDNQFNGDQFDPTLSTGESFTDTKTVFFDSNIGINLHFQNDDLRSKLDIGFGLHHLNTPSQNFYANSTIDIPIRKDFYAMGILKLSPNFDILANGLLRYQGEYQEIVLGASIRIHLNHQPTKELAIDFGGNLRTGDAIFPYVGLIYRQWRFGFIYDINTSHFTNATNTNGGPEFTAIYTITQPKAPSRKLCPLF